MALNKWKLLLTALVLLSFAALGCGGDDDSHPASPVDTQPPTLPTGLSAEFAPASQQVVLSWDANTVDVDLAGYQITRTCYDTTVDLVATPQAANTFVDDAAGLGREVTYQVYAVDQVGNASAAASVSIDFTVSEEAPRAADY